MKHCKDGLARPCSANDMFLVTGGLECGNCGTRSTPELTEPRCYARTGDDKPCPLMAEYDGLCWVHNIALRNAHAEEE